MDDELTRQVNACLLLSLPGTDVPAGLLPLLADGLGGVILFARSITDRSRLAGLTAALRAYAPELLVATDEEGGDVTRLQARTGSSYPGNGALGRVDDLRLTERVGRAIGTDLAAVGVNLDLAPVADVSSDPRNPVIGVRSFGGDPDLVAAHTAAFVTGVQSVGVAACAKHFPGHGGTAADSHVDLPVVPADLSTLRDRDLPPFAAAIKAGVHAVMTAHVGYPELDDRPATISRPILTGLLREELGYDGVVVTDALSMSAIADGVGIAEGAVQALAAGADLLCVDTDLAGQLACRDAIRTACADGRLDPARVAEAAGRVRSLAARVRPAAAPHLTTDGTEVGREAARRALVVDCALPLPAPPYVIDAAARPVSGIDGTSASLLAALTAREPATRGAVGPPPLDVPALLAEAGDRPLVLAVREAHRRPAHRELVEQVLAARPDTVVIGCGTADDAVLAPGHYLGTLGRAPVNLAAAAELLLPGERGR